MAIHPSKTYTLVFRGSIWRDDIPMTQTRTKVRIATNALLQGPGCARTAEKH